MDNNTINEREDVAWDALRKALPPSSDLSKVYGECANAILPEAPTKFLDAREFTRAEKNYALQVSYPYGELLDGGIGSLMSYAKNIDKGLDGKALEYSEIAKIAEYYHADAESKYYDAIKGIEMYDKWLTACENCGFKDEDDIVRIIAVAQGLTQPQLTFGDEQVMYNIWVSHAVQKLGWKQSYSDESGGLKIFLPSGVYDYCEDKNILRQDFNEQIILDEEMICVDSLLEGCSSFSKYIVITRDIKSYTNMLKGCRNFSSVILMDIPLANPVLLSDDELYPSEIRLGDRVNITGTLVEGICKKFDLAPNDNCRNYKHYDTTDACLDMCGPLSPEERMAIVKKAVNEHTPSYVPFYFIDMRAGCFSETAEMPWALAAFDFREVLKRNGCEDVRVQHDLYTKFIVWTDCAESAYFNFTDLGSTVNLYGGDLDIKIRVQRVQDIATKCTSRVTQVFPAHTLTTGYALDDLELDAQLLMKIMEKFIDYKAWFNSNFPNGASSRKEVLERIG